jgi:hypothetical protein
MDKSIVLTFRFIGNLSQIKTINYINELYRTLFSRSFESLNYSILDKTSSNWKQKTKTLKFNQLNINKYEEILSSKSDNVYIDFELTKELKNSSFKSRDIEFSVSYKLFERINSLNFIFNYKLYESLELNLFSKNIVDFIQDNNCELYYGFILNVSNSKNPSLYIEGIGNYEISQKEQNKLDIWLKGTKDCDKKIWDIFWGNIISLKIIKEEKKKFIAEITEIVGDENCYLLSQNLFWINLEEDLKDFEILKYDKIRDKLYNYFKIRDLILS